MLISNASAIADAPSCGIEVHESAKLMSVELRDNALAIAVVPSIFKLL